MTGSGFSWGILNQVQDDLVVGVILNLIQDPLIEEVSWLFRMINLGFQNQFIASNSIFMLNLIHYVDIFRNCSIHIINCGS